MDYEMPSRPKRALLAWFGYASVHFAAGRVVRGLIWIALLLVATAFIFRLSFAVFVLVWIAQTDDAMLITAQRDRTPREYDLAMLVSVGASIVFALALRAFWLEAFKIPSGGMIPTLQVGDHIYVDKSDKHPQRGEVAVFVYPRDTSKDFIKRVVAVGGDTVEMRDDHQLVVNGTPVARQHVAGPCEYDDYQEDMGQWETHHCDAWDETLDGHTYRVVYETLGEPHPFPPLTVPAGNYFVLGDNRDNSSDSRVWGFVPQELMKGVARTIWWSSGPHGVRLERLEKRIH
jgi:signal peptidase I